MDIRMPVLDGIAATRQLTASGPAAPKVVILTTFDLDDYVYEALRAGASGFLLNSVGWQPPVVAQIIRTSTTLRIEYVLAPVCRRGDVVLDPFAGSGSSRTACERLDLDLVWRGCDIDAAHAEAPR